MPTTATIGGAAVTTPTSNMTVGNTGATWLSWMANVAGVTDPNTYPQIYKKYGKTAYPLFRDIIRAKGQEMGGPAQDLNVLEETAYWRPIVTREIISAGEAGAAITVYLHSSNYESTKSPVQERDVILIPAKYLKAGQNKSAEYVVMKLGTDALTNDTLTCYPKNTATDIDTDIPAGVELAVGPNTWAVGEGQPKGKNNFPVDYTYTRGIIKATVGIEQDSVATKFEPVEFNGNRWLINDLTIKMERDIEFMEDWMFFRGEKNSNQSVLLGTSGITGDNGILRSCDGLTTLMDDYSLNDTYDTTFDESHLDNVTEGLIAMGNPSRDVAVYCGHMFRKDMNDVFRDYMEKYSSSDLYDRVKNMLGVTPDVLNWNGVNFYFQILHTLSNPSVTGITASGDYLYEEPYMAIFIPDNPITVSKFGEQVNASIPNIGVQYTNYNGENNGKVFNILKGMTNLEGGNLGTDKAGVFYYMMSESKFFGGAWEQKFLYRKQK